jgi:hypothetical protein
MVDMYCFFDPEGERGRIYFGPDRPYMTDDLEVGCLRVAFQNWNQYPVLLVSPTIKNTNEYFRLGVGYISQQSIKGSYFKYVKVQDIFLV